MDREREKIFYNALAVATGGGYDAIKKITAGAESFEASFREAEKGGGGKAEPEAEWEAVKRAGVRLVLKEESEYPEALKEIAYPPFGIYFLGK